MGDHGQVLEQGSNLFRIIRDRLDPQGTLPHVLLQREPGKLQASGTLTPTDMNIVHEGNVIGTTTFLRDKRNKEAWFNGITIDEEHRGKGGYGFAAYVAGIEMAVQDGLTFRTHEWSQTEGAKHIWEILVDKGVAKVITPFVPDGKGGYVGHYAVKSLEELKSA